MGGSSTHVTSQKYDGVVVQSSLKGVNIPKGWGTFMTGCNLLDYLDFTAKTESSKSAGGKGGGGNASYDYRATLVLGICVGPIAGIRTIYKDQAIFTAKGGGSKEVNGTTITYDAQTPLQAAGLTQMFTGTIPQAPWSYLTSNHPSDAIGYPGLAYVTAENYDLNTSATSPNHNFEVQSAIRATIAGVVQDDANPADILPDLLANVPQWPTGAVGDLSTYSTYCLATGLLLSPLASGGRQASDLVTEILQATNSDCLWEDGLFKVVPYGDTPSSGNGATYTPDLTPVYDFTWDDIVPNSSGEDPVQWDLKRPIECYNYVQVSYLDRSQQYASDTVSAIDQANINAYGLRKQDAVSLNSICLQSVANTISQIMVQRSANVRRTAQWMASELFGLLSPMDLVTLPTRVGGRRLMRDHRGRRTGRRVRGRRGAGCQHRSGRYEPAGPLQPARHAHRRRLRALARRGRRPGLGRLRCVGQPRQRELCAARHDPRGIALRPDNDGLPGRIRSGHDGHPGRGPHRQRPGARGRHPRRGRRQGHARRRRLRDHRLQHGDRDGRLHLQPWRLHPPQSLWDHHRRRARRIAVHPPGQRPVPVRLHPGPGWPDDLRQAAGLQRLRARPARPVALHLLRDRARPHERQRAHAGRPLYRRLPELRGRLGGGPAQRRHLLRRGPSQAGRLCEQHSHGDRRVNRGRRGAAGRQRDRRSALERSLRHDRNRLVRSWS